MAYYSLLFALMMPLALVSTSAAVAEQNPRLDPMADSYPHDASEFSSAIVIDAGSGKELYVYQPDKKWPAASITKLLTALVIVQQKPKWSAFVSLRKRDEVGGGRLRVRPGATMTMRDLLFSSIVGSANNATMALVRGSGVGMKTFVARMNRMAKQLKMASSSFVDPTGISEKNISTARDIGKLAAAAFNTTMIREPSTTATYRFTLRRPKMHKVIHTTNRLLALDDTLTIHGGKTGYLEEAQHNLVVQIERKPPDLSAPPLLIVVLGAPDKEHLFATAKALAEWAWKAYEYRNI